MGTCRMDTARTLWHQVGAMSSSSSPRVLVVDDDETMCDLLERSLRRQGFAVTSHPSAEAALEGLDRSHVDVVLTDLGMAGMSGLELCQRVLERVPDVPVIVLTGMTAMDS